jgi:hypothetical protein
MLPLVEVPPFVKKYAEGYQDLFSPEQFEHFRRYLTYPFRPPQSESLKSRDSRSRQWRRRMAFTAFGQHV